MLCTPGSPLAPRSTQVCSGFGHTRRYHTPAHVKIHNVLNLLCPLGLYLRIKHPLCTLNRLKASYVVRSSTKGRFTAPRQIGCAPSPPFHSSQEWHHHAQHGIDRRMYHHRTPVSHNQANSRVYRYYGTPSEAICFRCYEEPFLLQYLRAGGVWSKRFIRTRDRGLWS